MPTDDRPAKASARCSAHPGVASVAACDGCNRALCIACAIPVRGLVYGTECLPDGVASVAGPESSRAPMSGAQRLLGASLAVAAAATVLPWTRFGAGSGPFGAWTRTWAGVAALAFTAGLLVWLMPLLVPRRGPGRWSEHTIVRIVAILVASGGLATILALLRPTAFARPWIGPWVALTAAFVALGLAAVWLVRGAGAPVAPRRARVG